MIKTKAIQIRVTPEQYERIQIKANFKGYKTITSFILSTILEKDILFEQRFDEIYSIIKKYGHNWTTKNINE